MGTPIAYNARSGNTKAVEVEIIRAPGGAEAEESRGAADGRGLRGYWRSLREVMLRPIAGGNAPGAPAGDGNSGPHHAIRHKRSIIAGKTDYTDATLPEIVADIHDWSRACDTVSAHLVLCKNEIVQQGQSPTERIAERFIDHFLGRMSHYQRDLDRLAAELPNGVQQHHIEIATQLYESAYAEERVCADFVRDLNLQSHECRRAFRDALEDAYLCAQQSVVDMRDLGNLVPRLRALTRQGSR
jgi:hypothetical protein